MFVCLGYWHKNGYWHDCQLPLLVFDVLVLLEWVLSLIDMGKYWSPSTTIIWKSRPDEIMEDANICAQYPKWRACVGKSIAWKCQWSCGDCSGGCGSNGLGCCSPISGNTLVVFTSEGMFPLISNMAMVTRSLWVTTSFKSTDRLALKVVSRFWKTLLSLIFLYFRDALNSYAKTLKCDR